MKNNYSDLFRKYLPKYQQNGCFDIRDFAKDICSEFCFAEESEKIDELEWLKMQYVMNRLEADINDYDCYSFSRHKFISLDEATLKQLQKIDGDFAKAILGREKTLQRIREREACIGQMEMSMNGSEIVGITERKSITDLLKKIVNA